MKKIFFYNTVIGKIGITDNGAAITNLFFGDRLNTDEVEIGETELMREAVRQIEEYLGGTRKTFEIPVAAEGTEFQQSVWSALKAIPYGETRSYIEIAERVGNSKASRAVGMANNKNPVPILIPCHRVIGANGKLVGYGGGLDIKEFLLKIEKDNAKFQDKIIKRC